MMQQLAANKAIKPWNTPQIRWAVFEREPAICGTPDSVVFGPYQTEESALEHAAKYVPNNDNYYVRQMTPKEITGK
jgi:hypothetical protein